MSAGYAYPRGRLLVFAKAPTPGTAKTRLIPALGAAGAAELQRHLTRHTLATVSAARLCPTWLCCAPDSRDPFFAACAGAYQVTLRNQAEGDLGARMARAMGQALGEADYAVIIGTDCPALTKDYLGEALVLLDQGADGVLGPAEDGGYVLLGLRRAHASLFRNIPWGGGRVASQTRLRLHRLGWTWRELPTLWDVDRPADLLRLHGGREARCVYPLSAAKEKESDNDQGQDRSSSVVR